VDRGHRLEQRGGIERVTQGRLLDLVREDVQENFRIRVGVDVAAIVAKHLDLELFTVGEIAVVSQRNAERRIDIERLRLLFTGRPCRRIAALPDAGVTQQRTHVPGAEYIAHQAIRLVHAERIAATSTPTRIRKFS
jgi:hypothetical protein